MNVLNICMHTNSVIESTGCYLPDYVVNNSEFISRSFLDEKGQPLNKATDEIVSKLEEITQIKERRYELAHDTVHMATCAAIAALKNSRKTPEEIDGIIVAHNFGNILPGEHQGHLVPNLAAKVKHELGMKHSSCFAYDVLYGCPGWILGMHQAHLYLQAGEAKAVMVIGVEMLSRVVDEHDVDSMLFGDGAGATILVAESSEEKRGILGYANYSDCMEEVDFLRMEKPRDGLGHDLMIRMVGRSVFKYGVTRMPELITDLLRRLSIPVEEIDHFLFHQANGKMVAAIGDKLSELHGIGCIKSKSPLTLDKFGNTSVATIPTLLDLVWRGEMSGFSFEKGQKAVMASVGAGMHVNSLIYHF